MNTESTHPLQTILTVLESIQQGNSDPYELVRAVRAGKLLQSYHEHIMERSRVATETISQLNTKYNDLEEEHTKSLDAMGIAQEMILAGQHNAVVLVLEKAITETNNGEK